MVPTLAELKAHLGGEQALGSEHDVFLQQALDAALATAAREGGLIFDREAPQVVYRSGGTNGTAALWWTAQPVTVSKVELRNYGGIATGWTELATTEWEQLGGKLQRVAGASPGSGSGFGWPAGHSNIRVTLTAGFDEANPMPADLRLAILKLAAEEFRQRRGATPTSSRSGEGGTGAERMARRTDALYVIRSYQQVAGF